MMSINNIDKARKNECEVKPQSENATQLACGGREQAERLLMQSSDESLASMQDMPHIEDIFAAAREGLIELANNPICNQWNEWVDLLMSLELDEDNIGILADFINNYLASIEGLNDQMRKVPDIIVDKIISSKMLTEAEESIMYICRHIDLSSGLESVFEADIQMKELESIVSSGILKNITHLDLSYNDMDDSFLELLSYSGQLNNLTSLNLGFNNFKDKAMEALVKSGVLANLTELNLEGNFLSEQSLRILCESEAISQLESLNLSENDMNSSKLKILADSQYLKQLKVIHFYGISNECDEGLTQFFDSDNSNNLEEIVLLNITQSTDVALRSLMKEGNMPRLRELYLDSKFYCHDVDLDDELRDWANEKGIGIYYDDY